MMTLYRTLLFLLLTALGACSEDSAADPVLLAADPPAVYRGESVVVELSSLEDVFVQELEAPVISDGGLALNSLTIVDERHALAAFLSSTATAVGLHGFEIPFGNRTAVLDMTVLDPAEGPGTVTGEGLSATAGAEFAEFSIIGTGTHFDSDCAVFISGAEGFAIHSMQAVTETRIDVRYSIALAQEPVQATVTIEDGDNEWTLLFVISAPVTMANVHGNQFLVRGQVNEILIGAPGADFSTEVAFRNEGDGFELGQETVIADHQVSVPVRVPPDYPDDTLAFSFRTYSDGGARLQLVTVALPVLEPAFLALQPSRITGANSEETVSLVAEGIDLTQVETVSFASDTSVFLDGWEALTPTGGSATFMVSSQPDEGWHLFSVNDGYRDITAGLVVDTAQDILPDAFEAPGEIPAGDRAFVTVVLKDAVLVEDALSMEDDEDISVLDILFIDESCVVLELQVHADAQTDEWSAEHLLVLRSGLNEYDVHLTVAASGL